MVEHQSPKLMVEVRFLVGPPMKKYLKSHVVFIAIAYFLVINTSYAQTFTEVRDISKQNAQKIQNIDGEVSLIKEKISDLKNNFQLLYDGAKDQNDRLSHQISFVNYLLTVFSFLVTIIGAILALFINKKYEQIKEMKEIVGETRKYIDDHNKELYERIKRDETTSLLLRLEEVPEDIANISTQLLSRTLEPEDMVQLKKSYIKIRDTRFGQDYIILFLQHFTYLSLKDTSLHSDIVNNISVRNISLMFSRDFLNFTKDIIKYLGESDCDEMEKQRIISLLFHSYFGSIYRTDSSIEEKLIILFNTSNLDRAALLIFLTQENPTDQTFVDWVSKFLN